MPRIRQDNDARYALRASFVDENGNVLQGDKITIQSAGADGGMVLSPTEPAGKVVGTQWFNTATAEIFIWDGTAWFEYPSGPPGPQGPQGPQGPAGADGQNGSDATNYWSLNGGDVYRSAGQVGIGIAPNKALHIFKPEAEVLLQGSGASSKGQVTFLGRDVSNVAYQQDIKSDGTSLVFSTGGNNGNGYVTSEAMRINASGNVGIGVAPDSFNTVDGALQIGARNTLTSFSNDIGIGYNHYYNSGWKYANTDVAARFSSNAGIPFLWQYAASGTADGAITWTEAMRIDSSGNLALGATTASTGIDTGLTRMRVVAPNSNYGVAATFVADSVGRGMIISNQSGSEYLYFGTDVLGAASNNPLKFITSGVERMRIDSVGNVSVHTTTGIGKVTGPRGNEITVADDATVSLVLGTAGACLIHAYDVGLGDGALFFGTYKGGTTSIAAEGTHGWATTDTDGAYCIYKDNNSHTITFKNRTGAPRTMIFLVTAANTI